MNSIKFFNLKRNKNINPYYADRNERNSFAAGIIVDYLKDVTSILNIGGGGKRHLKKNIGDRSISVFEIDLGGDIDMKLNLDEIESLPFADGEFNLACAFDVLEHIEQFHLINDELLRVSNKHILISLPNSACEIFSTVLFNKRIYNDVENGYYSKYYGLPLQKPSDRHRWWIYFEDIVRFYQEFSIKNNLDIEFFISKENFKKRAFKFLFGDRIYYNFFIPYVWVHLSRK